MKKSNNNKPTIGDLIWNFLGKLLFPFCIVCLILTMFFNVFFLAKVPSGSMLNTIKIGDILLVKNSHFSKEIKRGDICVYINDKKLQEDYVSSKCSTNEVFYVPDNSYLFLGDNRANSSDARYWSNPYVDKKYIKGIVQCRVRPSYQSLRTN